jgi:hypothetical protein
MKGRCPDSLFCGLAKIEDYRWHINSTRYGNIVSSPGDVVYGALYFLSPRDEAGLDESEGVPWLYEKKYAALTSFMNHVGMEKVDDEAYIDGSPVPASTQTVHQ